ncbi:hypothetical protein K458DRAFT_410609 [Lentithecium fluviatile CBS 122367]|uniref:Uncharacterized protein n=1 Tax=Lentithecium fluviatile CBS 122367 TaxID=1168545 RepID=A0A6G1IDH2_9PLEO|nr:hypothetical protein K458DRAFT_410609 [Lentithecium fluviatile CBS 122367]
MQASAGTKSEMFYEKALIFSTLSIAPAPAMLPDTISFAQAAQDAPGQTRTVADTICYILMYDTITSVVFIALSAVPLVGSSRGSSAYAMAWVFSFLAVGLGVAPIIMYALHF